MSDVLLKHSRMPRKYEPKPVEAKVDRLESVHKPLIGIDPEALLKRYLSDESTISIAASYGITRQALGRYLLRNAEEDWKEAQVARAIARKEKAEDDLELAQDPLSLAKARELFKAATWDLERVCRRIYGEDRVQSDVVTPILNITISSGKPSEEPRHVVVSLAHVSDVQAQHCDQEAAHQEVITDVLSVDNTPK